jgi:hypothetical protein
VCYDVPMVHIVRILGDEIEVDENREKPRPFHTASEALETHYELLDWLDSDHGFDLTKSVVLKHKTNYGQDQDGNPVPPDDDGITEGYRSILWDTVNHNNTMFVSAHMVGQLQSLIPSFEDEPLWLTDLPDEKGVVFFEDPVRSYLSDKNEADPGWTEGDSTIDYWIKGFAYRRVRNSVVEIERNRVHFRINIQAPPNDPAADDRRMLAFESNDGIIVWPLFDAGEMFVAAGQWASHGYPPMLPMPFCAIPFGPRIDDVDERTMTDLYQMRQIIVTLFRLVWQYIPAEMEHFPRAERRRMERIARKHKKLPDDGEEIKIRHLRRLEVVEEHEPREVDTHHEWVLDHRIVVKGHPRDQWYPSLGPARLPDGSWNPDSHRKIWIEPHERGPEGSPLVLKHALDVVIR